MEEAKAAPDAAQPTPSEESKDAPPSQPSKKPSKKPAARITVSVNKKNFNRSVTIVTGLDAFSEG